MVAVTDEGPNAGRVQSLGPIDKTQLGSQASIGGVINITSDQEGIDSFAETKVNDGTKGTKGGV